MASRREEWIVSEVLARQKDPVRLRLRYRWE